MADMITDEYMNMNLSNLQQISGEVQTPHEFSDDSVVTWQELSEELGFEALLRGNGEGMGGKHRKHRYEGSPTT